MDIVSERKVEANRRNARLSTGPKTPAGKQAIRFNALKHGLLAKAVIIPKGPAKEGRREFQDVLRRFQRELGPQGVQEELQVERLAVAYWRRRRVLRCEVGAIQNRIDRLEADMQVPDESPTDFEETRVVTASDRRALRKSEEGVDFLLGLLREARREVQQLGVSAGRDDKAAGPVVRRRARWLCAVVPGALVPHHPSGRGGGRRGGHHRNAGGDERRRGAG
jgi:hypothetical protein